VVERWMAGTTSRDLPSGLRPAWMARVSIFIVDQDISNFAADFADRRRLES
jgi:hypothetical protein